MLKGISFQGFVPMRREASEASEMVSQVLFGEEFHVVESEGKWLLIALDFDAYQGWIGKDSIHLIRPGNGAEKGPEGSFRISAHPGTTILDLNLGQQLILPAGSVWPSSEGTRVSVHGHRFEILNEESWISPGPDNDPEELGTRLLSIPYLWGGRSAFGFDCSGLVQLLCRMLGMAVPRDSIQQAELGTTINFMHETRKGDLAFFDNAAGEIAHVGMVLEGGRIIHSWNQVRIDRLDQQGIYNTEKEAYTHKLRIIKRLLD